MLEKKNTKAESFVARGRHDNCICIYINQNYHWLPRQTIRTNAKVSFWFCFLKVKHTFSIFMTTTSVLICHGMS